MTNKELQEVLRQYPDNAEVVFDGVLFDYIIRKVHYDMWSMIIKLDD